MTIMPTRAERPYPGAPLQARPQARLVRCITGRSLRQHGRPDDESLQASHARVAITIHACCARAESAQAAAARPGRSDAAISKPTPQTMATSAMLKVGQCQPP